MSEIENIYNGERYIFEFSDYYIFSFKCNPLN